MRTLLNLIRFKNFLLKACGSEENLEVVKILIEKGANLKTRDQLEDSFKFHFVTFHKIL
jgi:hypothetical protein